MSRESADWALLALTPGIGPVGVLRLIETFGSAAAAASANLSQLQRCLGDDAARALAGRVAAADVETALAWAEAPGCFLLTLADHDYPTQLAEAGHAPPLLFGRGRRELLTRPMLAMVGGRQATPQGRQTAEEFARGIADAGYTIVSGLASGIDGAAHRGALGSEASTIAVIGTGIDRVYPASHRQLAHQLAEGGLILSEFPLGMAPLAHNFPRRNRIIAGLSRGCLVVEANVNSGSLITARLAAEVGREVLAIPGSIYNPQARGCHRLIKDGAKLVETVDDVLDEVGRPAPFVAPAAPPAEAAEDAVATVPDESLLLTQLGYDAVDVDSLAARLELTAGEVYAMLLELELEGRVASLPGGRFQRLS